MVYPNGREVHLDYPTGGLGDRLSRVSRLTSDAMNTQVFADYMYLGINTFGRIDHPLVTNGLRRHVDTSGDPPQWDRFGRVKDERWKEQNTSTSYDRYEYKYDRTSNRTNRDVTATGAPLGRDEDYSYDGLDRLSKLKRGDLVGNSITDAASNYILDWKLEALGNWKTLIEDPDGGGVGSSTTQTRTHNKANEVLTITGSTPDWIDPQQGARRRDREAPPLSQWPVAPVVVPGKATHQGPIDSQSTIG